MAEPDGGTANPPESEGQGAELAREIQEQDLELLLRAARRRQRRSAVWAFLGVSPGAIIPALGLLRGDNLGLLILLGFLVTLTQFYRMLKATREARALGTELRQLRAEG